MNTKIITPTRIKSLREYQGWSQTELAERSGVGQSYISRLEDGDAPNVSGIILGRIATALETTVDFLLGLTDFPAPIPAPNHPDLNDVLHDPLLLDLARAWPDLGDLDQKAFSRAIVSIAQSRRQAREE